MNSGKYSNIPIFIPHFGCKNDCVFCNQHSITGKKCEPSAKDVRDSIESFLSFINGRKAMVAFFGGSFTGIDKEKQKEYLSVAKEFLDKGLVCGIRLSTRPDYISEDILKTLKEYGVTNIELGAQSMCDDVLKLSNRGHSAKDTEEAAKLIKKFGFSLGLQMMPGLPGDTEEKSLFTAREIVRLGADEARVYPTCVLKNTKLFEMYESGEYSPISVEEAVEISAEVVKILEDGGVKVIRIGLQETDTLGDEVVAGGYHSAMGELVISRILRDEIEKLVLSSEEKHIKVLVPKGKMSQYLGHKRVNAEYLEKKYDVILEFSEEI